MGKSKAHMGKRQPKPLPTWTDVKAKLADFDRAALLDLIHHLYATHKENQLFLHARFGLEKDVLEPYKEIIDRWLWPDVLRNQDTSVARAKQAISDYKNAVGDPAGLAELMVFYCERAAGFCSDIASDDEGFFNALVRMFERALVQANTLPPSGRVGLVNRLVLLCYKKGAPQKGQLGSCRSRIRAMIWRRVATDQGLCRSARTGRAPRAKVRRDWGSG